MQTPATQATPEAPKALFPTLGSTQEVLDLAESKLPITSKTELYALFAIYHNTLLKTARNESARKAEKDKLLGILADKQDEALKALSPDEIAARIKALG